MKARVLMTADAMGGVWTYAVQLMRALREVHFALCTMGSPPSPAQRAEIAQLPNVTLFTSRYKLEWMDDAWPEVDAAGDWLLAIAERFRPDVVHLNGYAHAALPWNVPIMVVAHSCVLSWWRAVKHADAPARFDEYRRRVGRGLAAADLVIAPSEFMLDSLRENYHSSFRGHVIYNGCDVARFNSASRHPERSEGPHNGVSSGQTDLPDAIADERCFASLRMIEANHESGIEIPPARERSKILAAGRIWDEAKNLRALDQAAPLLKWPIEIAGDLSAPGGEKVAFGNVQVVGKLGRAEMSRGMASAAIFAAPARYEPFGLSILEAALHGCALLLGNVPSLRELWDGAALFVEPEDRAALAAALNQLIADENLRSNLADRARNRARNFSTAKMALQYRSAYRQITAREIAASAGCSTSAPGPFSLRERVGI